MSRIKPVDFYYEDICADISLSVPCIVEMSSADPAKLIGCCGE